MTDKKDAARARLEEKRIAKEKKEQERDARLDKLEQAVEHLTVALPLGATPQGGTELRRLEALVSQLEETIAEKDEALVGALAEVKQSADAMAQTNAKADKFEKENAALRGRVAELESELAAKQAELEDTYSTADKHAEENSADETEDLFVVECPACEKEIPVTESELEQEAIRCPECGEEMELDLDDVEE